MVRGTALLLAMVTALAGCGGGNDGGSSGVASAAQIAAKFSVDPATVVVTSHTTTTPFSTVTYGTGTMNTAWSSTCAITPGNYSVLETPNVIVYNADTVSTSDLDLAARYADAAIISMRSKYSIPGSVGLDGANKIRVCITTNSIGGSAGYNDLFVQVYSYPNRNSMLADLIIHEMTHALQNHALHCTLDQYGFERWLNEGMALSAAAQDMPSKSAVSSLQATFAGGTPFSDTWARSGVDFSHYPGYVLAYKTFLGEFNKTDVDVYNFLANYGSTVGCPSSSNSAATWKTQFDAYFGSDLRGTGVLGSTFWTVASRYAL